MKETRICHITSVHPRYDTRIYLKECQSLVQADYKVNLIVADGLGDVECQGLSIKDVGKARNRLLRLFSTVIKIYREVKKTKPDIVHFHDPELMFAAFLLKTRKRAVVYDMHENFPKQILDKNWLKLRILRVFASTLFKFIERIVLNRFHIIFAELSYKKHYKYIKKSETILNYPVVDNIIIENDTPKSKTFSVAYIGAVSKDRGIINIARAINILKSKDINVNFHCIGPFYFNNEEKEIFKSIVKNNSGIIVYGKMDQNKAFRIVSSSDIGLAILRPIPNYLESYPTKMFEYMAMGLPVIVSDFPLYKKIVSDDNCGVYVNPESIDDIAAAILSIKNDPETASKMGANGRKAVEEKYNWNIEKEKLFNFYKKIITKSK